MPSSKKKAAARKGVATRRARAAAKQVKAVETVVETALDAERGGVESQHETPLIPLETETQAEARLETESQTRGLKKKRPLAHLLSSASEESDEGGAPYRPARKKSQPQNVFRSQVIIFNIYPLPVFLVSVVIDRNEDIVIFPRQRGLLSQ